MFLSEILSRYSIPALISAEFSVYADKVTTMNTYNLIPILIDFHALSPCIVGSGVLTKDGLVLESVLPIEQEEDIMAGCGAALSAVARNTARQILQCKMGAVLVKSDNGFVIVAPCNGELILAVIVTPDAALNDMLQAVERTARLIGQAGFDLAA